MKSRFTSPCREYPTDLDDNEAVIAIGNMGSVALVRQMSADMSMPRSDVRRWPRLPAYPPSSIRPSRPAPRKIPNCARGRDCSLTDAMCSMSPTLRQTMKIVASP